MRTVLACAALFLAIHTAQAGDFERGVSAYRHGDYAGAVSLIEPLARHGDPFAQFALAVMYDDGRGRPQDFSKALAWYTRAARAGLVDAQYMAGRFYGRGRGVKQNPARAFFWFNIAAAGGHPHAARLRDQQRAQVNRAQRSRIEAEAVAWQAKHPTQFTCKERRCIFPGWTARPAWNFYDPLVLAPE